MEIFCLEASIRKSVGRPVYGQGFGIEFDKLNIQKLLTLLIGRMNFTVEYVFTAIFLPFFSSTAGGRFGEPIDIFQFLSAVMHGIGEPCIKKHIE